MTCGVGAVPLAGLAALFVCAFLLVLNRMGQNSPRHLELEIVANSASFPASLVESLLSARGIEFQLHEMSLEKDATAKYLVNLRHQVELKTLSDELMLADKAALKSVSWTEKIWMRQ
jgi:hypothetical protein